MRQPYSINRKGTRLPDDHSKRRRDSLRGTGRTRTQMITAPRDAIFVWCNSEMDYPLALAKHLNRDDLRVVSPFIFNRGGADIKGLDKAIVIDHAYRLIEDHREGFEYCIYHNQRVNAVQARIKK